MEKAIEETVDALSARIIPSSDELSVLYQCSVKVATLALTVYADELREKGLAIAKAIADFETEMERLNETP